MRLRSDYGENHQKALVRLRSFFFLGISMFFPLLQVNLFFMRQYILKAFVNEISLCDRRKLQIRRTSLNL